MPNEFESEIISLTVGGLPARFCTEIMTLGVAGNGTEFSTEMIDWNTGVSP